MPGDTDEGGEKEVQLLSSQSGPVPADVYEDLLNRYERALIFAGQLQERNRRQLLLQSKNEELELQMEGLKGQVTAGESYIRLLESALKAMGVMKE